MHLGFARDGGSGVLDATRDRHVRTRYGSSETVLWRTRCHGKDHIASLAGNEVAELHDDPPVTISGARDA